MKRTAKRVLALVLTVMMLFSLAACGAEDKAVKTVEAYFLALSEKDHEKASEYILTLDEEQTEKATGDKKADPANDAFTEHFFDTFKYEILESKKVDKHTVNVKLKLNTADMTKILPEYLTLGLQLSMASAFDETITDEEIQKQLNSFMTRSLSEENASRREVEVTAKVVKHEGKWVIAAEEEFLDAVTGGMFSVGKALEEASK